MQSLDLADGSSCYITSGGEFEARFIYDEISTIAATTSRNSQNTHSSLTLVPILG
ncbi:hypothetical protein HIM_02202 [Hirsutella minnesotensis 3608]|nr:hypothetical protein HIM_02202 [Hirsutella minnesotensis 3608]